MKILERIFAVLAFLLACWLFTQITGCTQMIQVEEGTEHLIYQVQHPATQPVEIGQ